MSIPTFLFAGHPYYEIQKLKQQASKSRRSAARSRGLIDWRVRELENDVGYLTLVLASMLAKLDESGVLKRDDVKSIMEEVDGFDGVKDGRLDIAILRGATSSDLPELPSETEETSGD